MKTTEIELYEFAELSPESQQKALKDNYAINIMHKWWKSIYKDAEEIGLKITNFGLDRDNHCEGHFIGTCEETATLIKENHGPDSDTYKLATQFLKLTTTQEDDDINFKNELLELYAQIIQDQSDYLTSHKAIIEAFEDGEYVFEESGILFFGPNT